MAIKNYLIFCYLNMVFFIKFLIITVKLIFFLFSFCNALHCNINSVKINGFNKLSIYIENNILFLVFFLKKINPIELVLYLHIPVFVIFIYILEFITDCYILCVFKITIGNT